MRRSLECLARVGRRHDDLVPRLAGVCALVAALPTDVVVSGHYRLLQRAIVIVANHKRVHRVYRDAGLQVRRRRRKRLTRADRVPLPAPSGRGERWSMDFMADTLADRRAFRTLNIVDDFSRECVAIEVDRSLPGARVVRVLDHLRLTIGLPQAIVLDNGPEFAGRALEAWAYANGVELRFIRPGKRGANRATVTCAAMPHKPGSPAQTARRIIDTTDLRALERKQRAEVGDFLDDARLDAGLDHTEHRQLVDLVLRYRHDFSRHQRWAKGVGRPQGAVRTGDLQADQQRGPAQRRVFARKLHAAIKAVEEVLRYSTDDAKTKVFASKLETFAVPRLKTALAALRDASVQSTNFKHPVQRVEAPDPNREATQAFVQFFRQRGIKRSEADKRTAEIFTYLESGKLPEFFIERDVLRRKAEAVRKRRSRTPRIP